MKLEASQLLLSVSNLDESREFYVDTLGLPVVESHPKMFAVRLGAVRLSVMGGGTRPAADTANLKLMLKTADVDATVRDLQARGVAFRGEISEAPGFMRFVELADPDGNALYLAQYFRDPLEPKP